MEEFLKYFRKKYLWRIFGPGNNDEVLSYFTGYDAEAPFDLRESDAWPCDPESKFVPYGKLSIQKLVEAKVSYKEFDLRCVPRELIKWFPGDSGIMFEKDIVPAVAEL
eukprot:COSAG02_NODE_415_length_22762_cov_133.681816_16_plen_108_part_00